MNDFRKASKIKHAEVLSTTGAAILGAGVALVFAAQLRDFIVPFLVLGVLAHAGGMYVKHRLEVSGAAPPPLWYSILYWACWIMLLLIAGLILARAIR